MLETLKIRNFTVFKNADLEFSRGLNIIIGKNGSGKSHLLKLGYAVLISLEQLAHKNNAKDVKERTIAHYLTRIFCPDSLGDLASKENGREETCISSKYGADFRFVFSKRNMEKVSLQSFPDSFAPPQTLFIPPKEIISVYPGFQRSIEKRELSFDLTYLNLAKALSATPLKKDIPKIILNQISEIKKHIGAEIIKNNEKFYFKSKKGEISAHIEAGGFRKLGMLAYLLRCGEIGPCSTLFWDEPETNLNPELLSQLVKILLNLSEVMQIIIATHSLFLLRELDIMQESEKFKNLRYFGLHILDNATIIKQSESSDNIGAIATLNANIRQSEEYLNLCYTNGEKNA